MYYTGVGSRETPADVCRLMKSVASVLESKGWTLRTGDAHGADTAFSSGCKRRIIFSAKDVGQQDHASYDACWSLVQRYHPRPDLLKSDYVRRLMCRNNYQVLGERLAFPSDFLICWTPDGCINAATRTRRTGGTGYAITVAAAFSVPVFNLSIDEHRSRLERFVKKA